MCLGVRGLVLARFDLKAGWLVAEKVKCRRGSV
jgi:hypothetical protein